MAGTRRSRWSVSFGLPMLFALFFAGLGAIGAKASSAQSGPQLQGGDYAGPDTCGICHEEIHAVWQDTRHANAFSSPIFQQNWAELGSEFTCLTCHTTG